MNRNLLALLIASTLLIVPPMACAQLTAENASALFTKAKSGDASVLSAMKQEATQGDAKAQLVLGVMYEEGQGVQQDHAEAVKWLRMAADQGVGLAQYTLGRFAERRGTSQDYAEAVKWFRMAANQGYARAQHNLGVMYILGQGVPQDYAEAAKWSHKAADQGVGLAQYNLGGMYIMGTGVPKDYEQGYKWLALSKEVLAHATSSQESVAYNNASKFMDVIAKGMTVSQITRAQQELTAWKSKHPNVQIHEE